MFVRFGRIASFLCFILLLSSPSQAETTKIGVIVPLSGSLAQMGESLRDGFTFWKERHKTSNLEFLFEDDQFQPKLSATAAQKLISIDKVQALVTFTSGPGMAVAPLAEKYQIVHFCLTVDSRLAKGKYNFVHLFQSRDAARRLLQKFKEEGITKVGIMRFIEDAAQLSASELSRQAPEYGIKVLFDDAFPAGTTDFRSRIVQNSTKGAEAVMIIALPPELELLARQMRELRFAPKLTSIEIFSISAEPKLFDGLWFAQPAFPAQEYVAKFRERFKAPVRWGHYADNIATLLEAAVSAKDTEKPLVSRVASLKGIPSTVGQLSADEEGVFAVPVVIAIMKDGVTELLEK
ncbi:MAG: ABC transporter substrate-binding protein [Oligoflexia bacterium]|nr:ABC transporter substrate-binding protein [Oligoflexia bacterium]